MVSSSCERVVPPQVPNEAKAPHPGMPAARRPPRPAPAPECSRLARVLLAPVAAAGCVVKHVTVAHAALVVCQVPPATAVQGACLEPGKSWQRVATGGRRRLDTAAPAATASGRWARSPAPHGVVAERGGVRARKVPAAGGAAVNACDP